MLISLTKEQQDGIIEALHQFKFTGTTLLNLRTIQDTTEPVTTFLSLEDLAYICFNALRSSPLRTKVLPVINSFLECRDLIKSSPLEFLFYPSHILEAEYLNSHATYYDRVFHVSERNTDFSSYFLPGISDIPVTSAEKEYSPSMSLVVNKKKYPTVSPFISYSSFFVLFTELTPVKNTSVISYIYSYISNLLQHIQSSISKLPGVSPLHSPPRIINCLS